MKHDISLTVNGTDHELTVDSRTLLVDALRDKLGYTGTNVGCESTLCGACTIHLDGRAVKSCTVLAVQADGQDVTTIEGLGDDNSLHAVQRGFTTEHGLQCGYCTPGMIMNAAAFLERSTDPSESEIRKAIEGNVCRCTGYGNIVDAITTAAKQSRDGKERS